MKARITRLFYVIYIGDYELESCLNAIRLLANPAEKRRAHITVRGPYERRMDRSDFESFNQLVTRASITLDGPDSFFDTPSQNTVYLRCESEVLKTVWKKPDYSSEFNPHVTIYDGPSRSFANKLLSLLRKHHITRTFRAQALDELVTKGQRDLLGVMEPTLVFSLPLIKRIADRAFSYEDLHSMPERERLSLIGRFTDYLSRPVMNVHGS